MIKNKKKMFSWNTKIFLAIIILALMMGFILGLSAGIKVGERQVFENFAIALNGAELNVEIDLNETELVDRFKEAFIPLLNQTLQERSGEDE